MLLASCEAPELCATGAVKLMDYVLPGQVIKLGSPLRHILLVADSTATVYAMDARCGHRGGPLESGDMEDLPGVGLCIRCPWHGHRFQVESGHEVVGGSLRPSQRTFPTEIRHGALFVRMNLASDSVPSDSYAGTEAAGHIRAQESSSLSLWLDGCDRQAIGVTGEVTAAASAPPSGHSSDYIADEFLF
ncbi:Rfesd [Symbiodinium microadriaticum]|nr:Rfesd [Symbiodinium microadriaticum]